MRLHRFWLDRTTRHEGALPALATGDLVIAEARQCDERIRIGSGRYHACQIIYRNSPLDSIVSRTRVSLGGTLEKSTVSEGASTCVSLGRRARAGTGPMNNGQQPCGRTRTGAWPTAILLTTLFVHLLALVAGQTATTPRSDRPLSRRSWLASVRSGPRSGHLTSAPLGAAG